MFDDRFMMDSPGGCLMERRFRNVILMIFRPPEEIRYLQIFLLVLDIWNVKAVV